MTSSSPSIPCDFETSKRIDPNDSCKWKVHHTEYLDKYKPNKARDQLNTRESHMNNFLYSEMAKAYINRARQRRHEENTAKAASEYKDHFDRMPSDHSKEDEANQKMYPLYGTEAISWWLPKPQNKLPFKQVHCLTKLNSECYDEQFR